MIRLLVEAGLGLRSVTRAMMFREDWSDGLNLTTGGLVRSFVAVLLSLPVFWLVLTGSYRLVSELSDLPVPPYTSADFIIDQLRIWLVFPILAVLLTRLAGIPQRFVHWVILHNWAVLFLFLVQAGIIVFYLAGLLSASMALDAIRLFYLIIVRAIVHISVAFVALQQRNVRGVTLAFIPVMVDLILMEVLP